jgi:hypothetical protein
MLTTNFLNLHLFPKQINHWFQASPESRRVFGAEIQRVDREGAEVLRELGDKVETMTKLSSSDILSGVHLAAEELQKKIERSYLLVNTERWDSSKQAQWIKEVLNDANLVEKENKNDMMKIVDQTLLHQSKSFRVNLLPHRFDSS